MTETNYNTVRPEGPGDCPWGCGPLKLVGRAAVLYIQPLQARTRMYSCMTCGYAHGNTPLPDEPDPDMKDDGYFPSREAYYGSMHDLVEAHREREEQWLGYMNEFAKITRDEFNWWMRWCNGRP